MVLRRVWRWTCTEWAAHRWHILEAIGALGTAVGAIMIPVILDHTADQRHVAEIETRTLQMVNEVNREIADILEENPPLARHQGKYIPENFTYAAITLNDKTNTAAIRLLNEYEFVCLGANKKLFNSDIMKELRGSATGLTWSLYKDYIVESRKASSNPTIWKECEDWLKANEPDWKW